MCSKMSQLHAELSEQAIELGFENIEEALANGYEVDYEAKELVSPYVLCDKAHKEVHEAWLKEQEIILGGLMNLMIHKVYDHDIIERAYKFIKEQCHD